MYENYLKKEISHVILGDIKRYCLKQCDIRENIYYIYIYAFKKKVKMTLSIYLLAAIAALGTINALEGPNICTRQET